MTLSITRKAVPLFIALSLFGLLFASFAFAQVQAATECTLRADITAAENTAITGTGIAPVLAGNLDLTGPEAGTNALLCSYGLVKWASNILFVILFTVAILFLAWAAFLFITAGQNPDRAKQARQYIIYAVVGLIIAALARVIPAIARGLIGV